MEKALDINSKNFETEVLKSEMPVLIDFWGSWCPPCKMIEPTINELANDLKGKIKVGKINVDQNPSIRMKYNIIGLPTFILFKDGKEYIRKVGAMSKKQLLNMIENSN